MAFDLVTVSGLWPILRRIPWLVAVVGRWYFTPERLASLVYVDLFPRHESARVDLGGVQKQLLDALERMTKATQALLKEEWDKVKRESEHGPLSERA